MRSRLDTFYYPQLGENSEAIKIVYKRSHSAPEQHKSKYSISARSRALARILSIYSLPAKNAIHSVGYGAILWRAAARRVCMLGSGVWCVCVRASFMSQFIGVREKRPEHKNVFRHLTFLRVCPACVCVCVRAGLPSAAILRKIANGRDTA